MIYYSWSIIFLLVCTAMDLKERKINIQFCIVHLIGACASHIAAKDSCGSMITAGIVFGVVFFFVSFATKGKLGAGDAMMILVLGEIVGIEKNIVIVLWAFLFCAVFSIVLRVVKKRAWDSTLPFAPFLLCGDIAVMMGEGIFG